MIRYANAAGAILCWVLCGLCWWKWLGEPWFHWTDLLLGYVFLGLSVSFFRNSRVPR